MYIHFKTAKLRINRQFPRKYMFFKLYNPIYRIGCSFSFLCSKCLLFFIFFYIRQNNDNTNENKADSIWKNLLCDGIGVSAKTDSMISDDIFFCEPLPRSWGTTPCSLISTACSLESGSLSPSASNMVVVFSGSLLPCRRATSWWPLAGVRTNCRANKGTCTGIS